MTNSEVGSVKGLPKWRRRVSPKVMDSAKKWEAQIKGGSATQWVAMHYFVLFIKKEVGGHLTQSPSFKWWLDFSPDPLLYAVWPSNPVAVFFLVYWVSQLLILGKYDSRREGARLSHCSMHPSFFLTKFSGKKNPPRPCKQLPGKCTKNPALGVYK